MIRTYIGAALMILGATVFVLSLIGVFRFGYILDRLHACTLADTLGTLCVCLGLSVLRGFSLASAKLALVVAAMWITGAVCKNRIAAAELAASGGCRKHVKEEE